MPLRWFLPVLLGWTLWAWWCRWDQSSAWREGPDEFTVDGRPLMGTADAYKWLRYAGEIRQGTYRPGQSDPLMAYPDGLPRPRPAPLLSVLLAHLSSPEDGALERTGLVLIPILAVMFIVPLGLLLWRAGYPAAAVLAGFVGSGCEVYFVRTSAGRVDTDALILFLRRGTEPDAVVLGWWDLVEGRARRAVFVNLSCQLLPDPGPDCPPIEVDMERGWTSDGRRLRFAVVSDGGTVVTTMTYRRGTGWYYLELVEDSTMVHLIGEVRWLHGAEDPEAVGRGMGLQIERFETNADRIVFEAYVASLLQE